MSSRFHNKYHRHNHHTIPIADPRYPDAGYDPIASPDSPFLGDFVMLGTLSARVGFEQEGLISTSLSAIPAGVFEGFDYGIRAVAPDGIAIEGIGDANITGNLSVSSISFTGQVLTTYQTPVTATGDFLIVEIEGTKKAIRLWQYE